MLVKVRYLKTVREPYLQAGRKGAVAYRGKFVAKQLINGGYAVLVNRRARKSNQVNLGDKTNAEQGTDS